MMKKSHTYLKRANPYLKRSDIYPIMLLLIMFSAAFYFSPLFSGDMKVHWNAYGEADGYGGKFLGLFLLPVIALSVYICMMIIPFIEVHKEHIKHFKYYNGMKNAFVSFFFILYLATLLSNMGYMFNMTNFIVPFVGLLLVYMGFIIKDVKRNFFIGIRTPWTLSSDKVWKKTHELGSKTFMLNGIIVGSSFLFKQHMALIVIVSVLANVMLLFVYSYLEWKK